MIESEVVRGQFDELEEIFNISDTRSDYLYCFSIYVATGKTNVRIRCNRCFLGSLLWLEI